MCAKYLVASCENVSISLWILERGIWRILEVFSCCCMYGTSMHAMMTMGGDTSHLCWDSNGRNMAYLSNLRVVASNGINNYSM